MFYWKTGMRRETHTLFFYGIMQNVANNNGGMTKRCLFSFFAEKKCMNLKPFVLFYVIRLCDV